MLTADENSGIARVVLNLAGRLAASGHDVEVLSLYRNRRRPAFAVAPGVTITYLLPYGTRRADSPPLRFAEAAASPSVLGRRRALNALTDRVLADAFAELGRNDVLITVRPALHPASLVLAPRGRFVRIGWDHLNFRARYDEGVGGVDIDRAIESLDAYVVLTEADARDYCLRHPDARVEVIRNGLPWKPAPTYVPRTERRVVAAGRLMPVKGFDLLISAWARVSADRPDWTLSIYGEGGREAGLREWAARLGVEVDFAGFTRDIRPVFASAPIVAVSSRSEGFGMTLIEAASQGAALVAFDCPRGPGEIVVDRSNGRLVPAGDVPALAAALAEAMDDEAARVRWGRQALQYSWQYDAARIVAQWEALIEDLR